MLNKKLVKITFLILCIIIITFIIYLKFFKTTETVETKPKKNNDKVYSSNIISDVEYISKDSNGNEYIIRAKKGEIDYTNSEILYLTEVRGLILLKNSDNITITSNFGKYNTSNFDTIFTKNVIINYLDNQILGEYLDFSIERNSMIVSKNVVYNNLENILEADVMEMNIKTKDTKIFMFEKDKKVNIKSLN